jgi:serine/threonine protein kinase
MLSTAMQEVINLASLNHPNIVGYKECFLQGVYAEPDSVYLYIQMELCKTSLLSLIENGGLLRYEEEDSTFIAKIELVWMREICRWSRAPTFKGGYSL